MADKDRTFDLPAGRCLSVAPGLPTTDMARTAEHYGRLGFVFSAPGSPSVAGAGFAIGGRDGIELHFALKPDHDPARTATWVYIGVEDADAMGEELTAAGAGQGRPVRTTDDNMRELAHIDPDGNLLLFGSPLPRDPARHEVAAEAPDARPRTIPESDRAAFELLRAIKRGDAGQLAGILGADPGLASCWIGGCTPLHHFADAPGHLPNAAAVVNVLVAAGADPNAHARDTWHHETPLHWAASNDDVALIDALIDAGADIEHPGSSIGGGPPIQSALGYAQWAAVRRLWQRGAKTGLPHAAVLGLAETVTSLVETSPPPDRTDVSVAFWNACRAGQLPVARYLLAHGAELDWPAPWDGSTPLDAATAAHQRQTAAWLRGSGAHPGARMSTGIGAPRHHRPVSTTERPLPPLNADEHTTLRSWLDFHRATLAIKCEGGDDEQAAAASVPPSGFTLTGLVQHMAEVERNWFRRVFAGEQVPPIYDPQADPRGPGGGFELAENSTLDDALATWRAEIARAREHCAGRALTDTGRFMEQDVNLRWIYVHMIEEYARHNGHADLLRERTDGATGV